MKHVLLVSFCALILLSCATPPREQSLVSRAVDAMGGAERLAGIKTLTVKGSAKYWEPEQSEVPGGETRFTNESSFERIIDAGARTTRIDWVRNFATPWPRTFTFSEVITSQAGYVIGVDSYVRNAQSLKSSPPAHSMSSLRLAAALRESRRAAIAGLVLAMHDNSKDVLPTVDVVHEGRSYPAVSYGDFIVAFDPQSRLPALVRTLDYDNLWGDVNYDMVLSDWRDIGGVKTPMRRKYELSGRRVADLSLTDVRFNQPIDSTRLQIPVDVLAGAAKPATGNVPYQWVIRRPAYMDSDNVSYDTRGSQGLRLQEIAPGVQLVQGGTHNSLVVEMSDHLIVIEAPVSDAQSLWLVGQTRARFPGKPIRWLALTHHHMDHAGGLRAILAEGATLVVGQGAGAHFRRVLEQPTTRNPDLPARSYDMTPILEVRESHVMSDERGRQVIVYVMENPHAKAMLMGWVPDAKLGFVADVWSPGLPLPAEPNPGHAAVVKAVKRAGLQPERFVGGHGSTAEYQMLVRLVGQ